MRVGARKGVAHNSVKLFNWLTVIADMRLIPIRCFNVIKPSIFLKYCHAPTLAFFDTLAAVVNATLKRQIITSTTQVLEDPYCLVSICTKLARLAIHMNTNRCCHLHMPEEQFWHNHLWHKLFLRRVFHVWKVQVVLQFTWLYQNILSDVLDKVRISDHVWVIGRDFKHPAARSFTPGPAVALAE